MRICTCVRGRGTLRSVHVEVSGQLHEACSLLPYIGARAGAQLTRLAQQGLCSLRHLINPEMIFFKIIFACVCVHMHTHICAVYTCLYVCTRLCRCTCMKVWGHADTRGQHHLSFSTTWPLSRISYWIGSSSLWLDWPAREQPPVCGPPHAEVTDARLGTWLLWGNWSFEFKFIHV